MRSSSALSGDKSAIKSLVDGLKIDIQRLSLQFQRRKLESLDESKTLFIHLEDCVRSAENFVSAASDIVGSQSTTEFGGAESDKQWKRIEKWVPESSNITDAATTTSIPLPPSYSFHDSPNKNDNAEATLTSITKSTAEVSLDDPDPDIESLLIQHWSDSAKSAIDGRNYSAAEGCLKKILERSEAMYGEQFDGRDEILEMLATVYCKQRKWNETETVCLDLLNQNSLNDTHRFKIMNTLAELSLGKEDYASATKWCRQAMRGVKATVGMKNAAFYESVCLFLHIHEAKGDFLEAEAYRTLLPPDYESTISH